MEKAYKLSETELRRLQFILLDMLMILDGICKKHNIRYCIIAGTLLGAVRHKGFIPWDDDLDVAMTRDEYERFRNVCNTELDNKKMFFQDNTSDQYYRWGWGRLRRVDSEFVRVGQEHLKMQTGIFLDVFPIDNVPNVAVLRGIFTFQCFMLRKILYSEVGRMTAKQSIHRLAYMALSKIPIKLVFKQLEKMHKYNEKSTNYARILMFPTPRGRPFGYLRSWYVKLDEIEFEGKMFPCVGNWDEYLRYKFGKYMTLPPVNQRHWHPVSKFELPDKGLNNMYNYLIVGAGIFGATLARQLTDDNKRVLVIDRRSHIAGNIYTERINGIDVHKYGAHIFHTDSKKVWDFVNRFAEFNNYRHTVTANYNGEIYNLPFNMNTFNKLWGVTTPKQAKVKIEEQSGVISEPKNLEEQAISLVGIDIFEKLIKGYTEKQWGRYCIDLPAFIIKRLPVRFSYDNSYFNNRYQGIPIDGYTELVKNMLNGIEVKLDTTYTKELAQMAEKVIYSGPIDEYFAYCLGELEYRGLHFETETINTDNYQGCSVMNYTDAQTPFTRIHEHKHFINADTPSTIITREYPAKWKRGDEPYYSVNDDKNNALYARYRELAEKEPNVIFGGRLGSYRYFDMDKVIEDALKLAEKSL